MAQAMDQALDSLPQRVRELCARQGFSAGALLQILIAIQDQEGSIAPEAIDALQAQLSLPRSKIVAVASFYAFLSLTPHGRYQVRFSDNITDRHAGSLELCEQLCRELWVERGKVSEDGLVSVDLTSCIGLCDQGPAALINGRPLTRLDAAKVSTIAALIREAQPLSAWPSELFLVEDRIERRECLLAASFPPGDALRAALARGAEATLQEITASGLRGRGGAGFATAAKWSAARAAPGDARYVVANGDEGEPGTFKDRVLLAQHAHQLFEGMSIAAWVLGARQGFLYLRGEYRYLRPALERVIEERRAQGLLGQNILGQAGFDFHLAIHLGAGAYVCGEESALLESLEGKRGTPRLRPPFPVTHGYLGQPTVVNNVETFCAAAQVVWGGAERWKALGTPLSTGTKLLSISGDCARPGVYEVPFGVSVAEVLAACGAHDPQAVQVGGPSGHTLPRAQFERRIAFEDLSTAGAFMVFDESRDLFEVARNFVHFFAHESCGFCTPCRVGTTLLTKLMDKLAHGHGSPQDFARIDTLNRDLQALSHCGLGQSACHPVLDGLAHFRAAYDARLAHRDFVPAFDLDQALATARAMTGRDDPASHLERQG
ncbi:NADH-quinone oxidoreductase subunit F [Burkholderiales bacterium]|nr:NADH-quinone oxidoreductase subunit F [Burkholderiales bacterium]